MVHVLVSHQGGGLAARYLVSHIDDHVTVVLVGQHQVDPLVHRHERHLVVDGGLEIRVTAIPCETVGGKLTGKISNKKES